VWAVLCNNVEAASLLVAFGADPFENHDCYCAHGGSAFDMATQEIKQAMLEFVKDCQKGLFVMACLCIQSFIAVLCFVACFKFGDVPKFKNIDRHVIKMIAQEVWKSRREDRLIWCQIAKKRWQ
jgi:hypothetical protein